MTRAKKKNRENIKKILDILEQTYPNAKCELNYTTPFELLIATILSAQCTDVRVNKVTDELFKKYNKPQDFAKITISEISEEIKSCGLYKSKAQKIKETSILICSRYGGEVPNNMDDLISLPGVGRKTANVVLSNAFGVDAMAVDTHVFRVSNRIGLVKTQTPEKTEFELMRVLPKKRWSKAHHLIIFHGRRICKARKPDCNICPLTEYCNYYEEGND